jgi:hypothetical protein
MLLGFLSSLLKSSLGFSELKGSISAMNGLKLEVLVLLETSISFAVLLLGLGADQYPPNPQASVVDH